ncbi:MAG: alcohol dehydrogenase [Candidatus Firestonebacteria bacterium RIFOXYC2_FULL_39_67]|nr:MAG: alcohol dehydrogenase [Candidatus Firestonebacteria bacterium RIFOXYD2_FULL_39_29]OGF53290.1 MAG: alcohol dehydrogenase [Candidatus Firestonebacteria bacterium RIFOXYC2_FULL_39_67]OGF55162.1 MAG: alcohol dehydrogenase [Candidatus Firestonebacteria bacterium RifOxyC12_full_39_7]
MKAAVYLGPGKIEIREIPTPTPKAGEVLIKVHACAVCGTDGRIFYHGQANVVPPAVIGHEIAGEIWELGEGVEGFKKGEKVTSVTSVGCQKCSYCKKGHYNLCDTPRYLGYFYSGAFAEYIIIPVEAVKGNNILKVPENMSYPAMSLIEPLSCVINGQDYLKVEKGDTVVVIGAGPIGCMHAEVARASGAKRVILFDVSETRLGLAKRFEGITPVNSAKNDPVKTVKELTGGVGADVVVVACGVNAAQEQAIAMTAKRGRVSLFAGLPKDNPYIKFDANFVHYNEISVYGAFASYRVQFEKAMNLLASGKIDAEKFITHTFPLEKIVEGIETAKKGEGLKVVIKID